MKRVLKTIRQDNRKFISSVELKQYCDEMYVNYKLSSDYLISRGYLVNILEDIYYVKSASEFRERRIKLSLLELVGKSLRLKNVKNWYFGLYTALNLNKVKYEQPDGFFYLINDMILINSPITVLGKNFRFLRFKNSLFDFGIINNKINYSDHEKTILDLLYLWESNHINENRILIDLSKLLDGISKEKILDYVQYYPESNQRLLKKVID
ncbi:MAG: hypothetical protein ACFE9S_02965 [Candidatus Hermodarchaeota archaeon]